MRQSSAAGRVFTQKGRTMETATKQNNGRLATSKPETQRGLQLWLIDELTVLAAAMGHSVTAERLRIYARDLSTDLTREQLQTALMRARRELKFFPQISELRELAGANEAQRRHVEAEEAWNFANRYLRK